MIYCLLELDNYSPFICREILPILGQSMCMYLWNLSAPSLASSSNVKSHRLSVLLSPDEAIAAMKCWTISSRSPDIRSMLLSKMATQSPASRNVGQTALLVNGRLCVLLTLSQRTRVVLISIYGRILCSSIFDLLELS